MTTIALLATSPLGTDGAISIELAATAVGLAAIVTVLRVPARQWRHGGWSKAAWIFVACTIAVDPFGITLPLGALAALLAARRARRYDVPEASGASRRPPTMPASFWVEEES